MFSGLFGGTSSVTDHKEMFCRLDLGGPGQRTEDAVCCTDCKDHCGKIVVCDIRLYK